MLLLSYLGIPVAQRGVKAVDIADVITMLLM